MESQPLAFLFIHENCTNAYVNEVCVCVHNLPRSISRRCHQTYTHGTKRRQKLNTKCVCVCAIRQMKLSICHPCYRMCAIWLHFLSVVFDNCAHVSNIRMVGIACNGTALVCVCVYAFDTLHTRVYIFYGTISMSSSSSSSLHSTHWLIASARLCTPRHTATL